MPRLPNPPRIGQPVATQQAPQIRNPALAGRAPQFTPAPPLLIPIERCRHGQHLSQYRCRPTAPGMFEEQQLFLQVGCEVEQAEDLTQARPADSAQPGRLSIAADCARANQLFDMLLRGSQT